MATQHIVRIHSVAPAASRRGLHILLAEDNRQLRSLLATALYGEGHSVDELADGGELVEQLATAIIDDREDEIDLIISEQELPGIPGLSVLAGIRARGQSTPFVLMTGNEDVQARAQQLGAVILDRPLNLGAIREAIQRATAGAAAGRFQVIRPANDVAVVIRRSYGSA
jgi:CheY-like chemotaxis protein